MPSGARTAALGVDYLSVFAPMDLQVGIDNPSLIRPEYNNRLAIDYVGLFSGSNFGSVVYGRDFHGLGTFLFGTHFNSYGIFDAYSAEEIDEGSFYASDLSLSVGWGMCVDSNFSIGADFKPVVSLYESYSAFAFAIDVAGSFVSDDKRFAATVQARNIGSQIVTFNGTVESLPFNLSAACSFKALNAPFRLFFELDHLTVWNLSYSDPLNQDLLIDPYTGEPVTKPWYDGVTSFLDLAARHASMGLEIDIHKVFYVRLGYRYRQTAEMYADDRTNINLSGFSYGFGLHTKKFDFSFARRNYHLGQTPTFLSLAFLL